jgi:hypothetical protein
VHKAFLEPITTAEGTTKLNRGTNKDCKRNKKLVYDTNHDYKKGKKNLSITEQITATEGTKIKAMKQSRLHENKISSAEQITTKK